MKAVAGAVVFIILAMNAVGQEIQDSTEVLEQVTVRAYENNRRLVDAPAAISVVSKAQLRRYDNTSLVPALNANPGVRMEERSPGSYRLNIRGSTLRSPFGVRNVKVYYNGIPYTDPGGNSFFNQLGLYNIGRLEIIKGPGGSIYGAGTGGVILITTDLENITRGATVDYVNGSFGMNSFHANLRGGKEGQLYNSAHYQYQSSDGYRDHTKMERKLVSWDGVAKVGERGTLRAHFMQGDLFYQTPGALTAAEFAANPKAARPGAEQANASITQKSYLGGFNYSLQWNERWSSSAVFYAAYTRLLNPAIRNYERRTEPHFGSRNIIQFTDSIGSSRFTVQGGVELQQGLGTSKVYSNKNGLPDTVQTDDEIANKQYSVFLQGLLELGSGWTLTAGASFNLMRVEIQRLSAPAVFEEKKYNNEVAPRIAILRRIAPLISAYASVAKGFSPPTNGELLPSTGVISTGLQPEDGVNTEIGIKGNLMKGRLYFDVNGFYFRLNNTIAQRRDINGADYFVNAGATKQQGIETFLSYRIGGNRNNVKLWISHTLNNFTYRSFQKIGDDTVDLSGKKLPGIPNNYIAAGADVLLNLGFYANLTYFYSDRIILNDANTNHASSYNLLGARAGYRRDLFTNAYAEIFAAADNLFDVKYSLGNDINAFGGRYYNAAPGRNYSAGISLRYNW